MKITATKDNLLFGVTAVQKAVSTKNPLPILSCIRLEARENMLYFSATDLEIGIQCYVPVEVIREGVAVIPARHFSEIVRKLPDSMITLNKVSESELIIEYDDSQLTLKILTADEFPDIPDVMGDHQIQVKASILKQMIRQTVFAAGSDEGRPLFTGILCECQDDKIRLVATDTHRLALRQGTILNTIKEQLSFIVPGKMMAELARLMYEEEETCVISVTKNLVSFKVSNIRIICRLLEGQFPNYKQVIPVQYNLKIKAKTKRMQEAIERISLFTMLNDSSNTISIQIKENTMVVSSQSEMGQGYEQLYVEGEGEPVGISFNARYLLDVLKIMEAEEVAVEFTGSLSPCIVRPAESENFIYLLLPVRT